MTTHHASINGLIVPIAEANVSILDRGLLHGDGLYETIQARRGKCLRFDEHMARLLRGAEMMGLLDGIVGFGFSQTILDLLRANRLTDARIRVTITRGSCAGPTIVITADPLLDFKMETSRAIISTYRRDETNPLAGVKTLNCLSSVMARREAEAAGFDDAILLNTQGNVAEGCTANVFVVKGNRVITPSLDQGCLPGTIRAAVLTIAPSLGFEAEENIVQPNALLEADELFFSSAIKMLRPITQLGDHHVGSGSYYVCERILNALLAQVE